MNRLVAVINSALWAAYGDAIGFISELASVSNLKQRAGTDHLIATVPWKRKLGGKFGVLVDLPAGCYSDDTQLRLSVSRAIGGSGFFDVEAFAKVELPLWLSYSLGAGRGSKCAALNLIKKSASWNSNFFTSDDLEYINMGGNGAVMRVHPHVWSFTPGSNKEKLIQDIIRDAITTHGHPRGILGSVFHALFLLKVLDSGEIPNPNKWTEILDELKCVASVVKNDDQLYLIWLPAWENLSHRNFDEDCDSVLLEIASDIDKTNKFMLSHQTGTGQYDAYVSLLDAYDKSVRGSATKSALLASILAYLFRDDPDKAVTTSANALGSDTDTIGSMAGALLGATVSFKPSGELIDEEYISSEAERMYKISQGTKCQSFIYPDLLKWSPPSNPLDALQSTSKGLEFSVLGKVEPFLNETAKDHNQLRWQWFKTSFGQSLLIKHRKVIKHGFSESDDAANKYKTFSKTVISDQLPLINDIQAIKTANNDQPIINNTIRHSDSKIEYNAPLTIDEAFNRILASNFSPDVIGRMMLTIADNSNDIERSVALAALISKSRMARKKLNR